MDKNCKDCVYKKLLFQSLQLLSLPARIDAPLTWEEFEEIVAAGDFSEILNSEVKQT